MRASPQPELFATTARCPRCAYDLRGAMSAWAESCPLQGRCAECGLEFSWAHVLCPGKFEPPWCVEFAPRRRWMMAEAATSLRSLRPWPFWSSIRMSMPLRPRRLLTHVLVLPVLAMVVAYIVVQAGTAASVLYRVRQVMGPSVPLPSYGAAIRDAVFTPSSSIRKGPVPYVAPRELHEALLELDGPAVLPEVAMGATVSVLTMSLWLGLLLPASFVLLPVSRRRARVRWEHLARVAVYGMIVPAALLAAATVLAGAGLALDSGLLVRAGQFLLWFGMLPAIVLWWTAAIGRYLRMPHGLGVAVLLSILCLLLLPALLGLAALGISSL